MSDKDDLIYDEDDSVAFIQNYLPQELKGKFSNDDINYIVDLIYEFYESKVSLMKIPMTMLKLILMKMN